MRYLRPILACVFFCNCIIVSAASASAAEGKPADANADEQAIRQQSQRMVEAYNGGQAKAVAAAFLPEGEAVDDEGNVYQGQEQLEQVFTKFFEAFPGAKMTLSLDSVRVLGPGLAVEDGTRKVVTQDGTGKAATRYTLLHVKRDGQWRIASAREFKADEEPTPHELLLPLAWLVGDWVDENAESVVMMSCRWSEDKNFLLMEYTAKIQGRSAMKTSQRIGWDPLHQRVRSWAFDSDGGYGDAHWTAIDTGWVLKSSAVLPDGQTGSATLFIEPVDKDKFVMRGFDRIAGDQTNDDYEVTIVRRPPARASDWRVGQVSQPAGTSSNRHGRWKPAPHPTKHTVRIMIRRMNPIAFGILLAGVVCLALVPPTHGRGGRGGGGGGRGGGGGGGGGPRPSMGMGGGARPGGGMSRPSPEYFEAPSPSMSRPNMSMASNRPSLPSVSSRPSPRPSPSPSLSRPSLGISSKPGFDVGSRPNFDRPTVSRPSVSPPSFGSRPGARRASATGLAWGISAPAWASLGWEIFRAV